VANKARRIDYTVGISYSDDAQVAINIIREVIEEHPFILQNPAPRIFVSELAESSVNIDIKIWAPSSMWYDVRTELLWKIKIQLESAEITIPFPQRVLHIKRESSSIPQSNSIEPLMEQIPSDGENEPDQ
jgi:small-conductance mechanosensitive channel